MRALTYVVAVTLDGVIADPDGGFDFLPAGGDHLDALVEEMPETIPGHLRGPLGISGPNTRFDTVVMGRHTYEPAVDAGIVSPYPHLDQVVFSTTLAEGPLGDRIAVVGGDPLAHVRDLKSRPGGGIWLCGGGVLAGRLLPEIDELVLKVAPVVAGAGRPVVAGGFDPSTFRLADARPYGNGVVVLRYGR